MNFHDINSIFRPSIDETTSRRRDCRGYFIYAYISLEQWGGFDIRQPDPTWLIILYGDKFLYGSSPKK